MGRQKSYSSLGSCVHQYETAFIEALLYPFKNIVKFVTS